MRKFHPESKTRQVWEYFVANPSEELQLRDIALKFDMGQRTVYEACRQLREAGMLECVHIVRLKQRPK